MGRISFNNHFLGYNVLATVTDCADVINLPSNPDVKVYLNISQFLAGQKANNPELNVAYKYAEKDPESGNWIYYKPGTPYNASFINFVSVGGSQQAIKYDCNGAGQKQSSLVCT